MRVMRIAGGLAIAVSALLLIMLGTSGLNVLNGWTILLGYAAGAMLLARQTAPYRVGAAVMLVLAILPALIGGIGLLYVPSLVMLPFGRRQHRVR